MNRAFYIVFVPALLVATAYFLLSIYAGVKLSYPRIAGSAVGLVIAIFVVHHYLGRKSRARRP